MKQRANTHIRFHQTVKVILALAIMVAGTTAFDIEHVGSIEDSLFAPTSITVSNDRIAVLEPFSKRVTIYSPDGLIQHQAHFQGEANALTMLSESVYLYCDREKKQISVVDLNQTESYDYFQGVHRFNNPVDMIVDTDRIFVLDAGEAAIRIFNGQRRPISRISIINDTGYKIDHASSFALDSTENRFFIFNQVDSRVWIIGTDGHFISTFGSFGGQDGQVTRGGDLLFSEAANAIIISDRYQNRVVIYDTDGNFIANIDLTGKDQQFNIPSGLAMDDNGMLYVASTESARIEVFYIAAAVDQTHKILPSHVYPDPFDTIQISDARLVSQANTILEAEPVTGFDFQLYTSDNSNLPVLETTGITPDEMVDSVGSSILYTAEWKLNDTLENNLTYQWRTRVRFNDVSSDWSALQAFHTAALPHSYRLEQNYPNPFNPATSIAFSIPEAGYVKLEIFNLLGQSIKVLADDEYTAGRHNITWNGTNQKNNSVASGIYFYRLTADEFVQSRKMVLIK